MGTHVERRAIVICAEDTEASTEACDWALRDVYREGDRIHLVFVVKCLLPNMEVFHGTVGTSYSFSPPGVHREQQMIDAAKARLEARFLPVLRKQMVPYELHLYAENTEAAAAKVGQIILRCVEERDASLVVIAAHNKAEATGKAASMGSVAEYITAHCKRPLAIYRP